MKLTISFIECNRGRYWFELETEKETCQCCYTRDADGWEWVDGENEPDLPHELQVLYNEVGDEAFSEAVIKGHSELFL